ncbi:MAG: hypothetical protein KC543_06765 [Myxococcales bacterium]|nr:hypothetical protein [Myxococcales bacterium]
MKRSPLFLVILAPFALSGCQGAIVGNAAVVAVSFGLFWATLSLGRTHGTND